MSLEIINPDSRWSNWVYAGWNQKFTDILKIKTRKLLKGRPIFWKKRYFVLCGDGRLFIFKEKNGLRKKGVQQDPCEELMVKEMKFWKSLSRRYCLQIENDGETQFIFSCNSRVDMLSWSKKLESVGAILSPESVIDDVKPEIATLEVKKWNEEHVKEWLRFVPLCCSTTETLGVYEEKFIGIDGPKLLEICKDSQLKEMGMEKIVQRKRVAKCIRSLRASGNFDYDYYVCFKKVLKMMENRGVEYSVSQLREITENLSDPKNLLFSYLSQDLKKSRFSEKAETEEEEVEGEGEFVNLGNSIREKASEEKTNDRFEIKLVLTEMLRTDKKKLVRKLISPFFSRTTISQEFGLFHAALIIGNFYIEWNDSSLVIPRRLSSSTGILSVDLKFNKESALSNDEILKKTAEMICLWNTRKEYKNIDFKKQSKYGNCQEFVDDLMAILGVSIGDGNDSIFIRKFLGNLKRLGNSEIGFSPSQNFLKDFGIHIDQKKDIRPLKKIGRNLRSKVFNKDEVFIKFGTHERLDSFVSELFEQNIKLMETKYSGELRLLKGFDRAFWLKHKKFPDSEKFKPMMKKDSQECGCPFGDIVM